MKLSTSIAPTSQKIETIVDADMEKVLGFAVDWTSDLMFFSQPKERGEEEEGATKHRLLACNLNGEFLTVIKDDVEMIFSLIVSPEEHKLYYVMLTYSGDKTVSGRGVGLS